MFQKAVKRSFAVLLSLALALTLMAPAVFAEELVQSVTILNPVDKLVVGESVQLTSEVLPENATNKTVNWSSSDESVLTVSQDGLVEAVGAGTAKIMASAQTEDMIFDTCEIKVIEKPVFKTDKDTYEPNETILVTAQTDYDVAAVILKDEAGNELNRIHVQSSIKGDYKEWNIKVSIAEAGNHVISVMATKTADNYVEIAKLPVTIAGGSGESSEPDTSKPDSSAPETSDPDASAPDESTPDSSSNTSDTSTSGSSNAGAGTSSSKPSGTSSSHSSSSQNPSTGESTPLFAMLGLAVVAGATMIIVKKREQK